MWNTILDILKEKAAIGVEVCVIYDDFGCIKTLPDGYNELLQSYGIHVIAFNHICPKLNCFQNYRDHRKICVIDGITAFTGGINLADEYINHIERFGHWKDGGVMLRGEGVQGFTDLFLQMWQVRDHTLSFEPYLSAPAQPHRQAKGYVIPYSDCPLDNERVGEMVYTQILNSAQRYVHIMTPYLILGHELESALCFAAKRGVEVSIIMPAVPDHLLAYALAKTHYKALVDSGVHLYEYTPGFVHAKSFVSDDLRATVGTINLDYRSLRHHFECACYLCGTDCVKDVEEDFQKTLAQCQEVTAQEAAHIGFKWRLLGSLMKLFAPLM